MTKIVIVSLTLVGVAAVVPGSAPARTSAAVAIPANRASNWVSATPTPARKKSLPLGARRWFGDTNAQAAGTIHNIEIDSSR